MSNSKPSLREVGGVARVIHDAKKRMETKMTSYLLGRKIGGYHDDSDEEIATQARSAGQFLGPIVADALGDAFQLGVNHSAAAVDPSEADTKPDRPSNMGRKTDD